MTVIISASLITTGDEAVFSLKSLLKDASWIVSGSSDSVTYDGTGDLLSASANLSNPEAWFRIIASDNSRQWTFQRGSSAQKWTIKRSKTGFTGSSDATKPPFDSEAHTLISASTAFPASVDNWLVSAVSGSSVGEFSDLSWFAFSVVNGGGNIKTFLFDEALLSGSYVAEDQDPYIWGFYYDETGFNTVNFSISRFNARSWKRFRHNLSTPSFEDVTFFTYTSSGLTITPPGDWNSSLGLNPYSSTEIPLFIPVAVPNDGSVTNRGWVGYPTNLKWSSVLTRANGQTLNCSNTNYYIYCGGIWVMWNSTAPAI